MHGSQPIEKKAVLLNNLAQDLKLKMLPGSIAIGVIAGIVVTFARLHLGLPGHKALFWMIPVITMRLTGGCKIGATAGTTGVIISTFSLQGHLAGGPLGLGLIFAAGLVLDIVANFLEQRRLSGWPSAFLLSISSMGGNLLCLVKKVMLPDGMGLYMLLGDSNFWFRFGSYAFFGFISGLIAWGLASCISKRR